MASLPRRRTFARRIGPAGAVNGLAQTLLKLTVPGVPDFYQGTEFWDQSLVDPDNRRPVDFARRIDALEADATPVALAAHWRDGRVKQAVIRRALALRREVPELFARGEYRPVEVTGLGRSMSWRFCGRTKRGIAWLSCLGCRSGYLATRIR